MKEENHNLDAEQIKYLKDRLGKIFTAIKKKYRDNKLKEIDAIYNIAFNKIKDDPKELFDLLLKNLRYYDGELFVYNDVMFDLTTVSTVWIEARETAKILKDKIDHDCEEHSKELSIKYKKIIDDIVLHGADPIKIIDELENEIDINMN